MNEAVRKIIFVLVGFGIVASIWYLNSLKSSKQIQQGFVGSASRVALMGKEEKEKRYDPAIEIVTPSGFINTPSTSSGQAGPITIGELVGKKVVLVDFWTYSCINCQRTTPYLNAWYEKYKDKGLEIIGIHTPEFQFEQKYENVKAAVEKFNIKYPVALDNDYATWHAYGNRYWPHKYLIDIDGFIVYDHIGEGAYGETERKIQELLDERMVALGMEGAIAKEVSVPSDAIEIDLSRRISPEIYFGADRNEYLRNGEAGTTGTQTFVEPREIKTNALYLTGSWNITDEFAESAQAGASIIFRYQAKNMYMVASAADGATVELWKDGVYQKTLFVQTEQLYHLITDVEYGEHTLEIVVKNQGLRAFTFTFG